MTHVVDGSVGNRQPCFAVDSRVLNPREKAHRRCDVFVLHAVNIRCPLFGLIPGGIGERTGVNFPVVTVAGDVKLRGQIDVKSQGVHFFGEHRRHFLRGGRMENGAHGHIARHLRREGNARNGTTLMLNHDEHRNRAGGHKVPIEPDGLLNIVQIGRHQKNTAVLMIRKSLSLFL